MDVLADVLSAMRTGHPVSAHTEGRAPWGLRYLRPAATAFHMVLHGTCWLVRPEAPPLALSPGDVILLRNVGPHTLADDPASTPVDFTPDAVDDSPRISRLRLPGPGAETALLCGAYLLEQQRAHPLLESLPPVVYLPTRAGRHHVLHATVNLLAEEVDVQGPGASAVVSALVDALLIHILRAWLAEQPSGWAAALTDPAIGKALAKMHTDPALPWTVEGLGSEVGLSRAVFARRFHMLVGEPPLTYLTRWRMTTAARALRESNAPLKAVSRQIGYNSEYAFAKAFKRDYGVAPGRYRRTARLAGSPN
ncbi:AraC family transcriptional regulator [Nocardia sp. NPDC049220]|uniref:AraC family transcriptional regulator n=1 Tax=Nocardia sp. NPDC049220 TaxID=3155273 RepID=UPI0033DC7561